MAELVVLPGGTDAQALLAGRPGDPGVLLLHDEHGLLPHLGGLADALAAEGLRAVAPRLPGPGAVEAAARAAGPGPPGVVGFGTGGVLALRLAVEGRAAAVVAYDALPEPSWPVAVPCPVMLHLPEHGGGDVTACVRAMALAGTPLSVQLHLGAGCGFANADRPAHVRSAASAAWLETVAHLRRALIAPAGLRGEGRG